MVIVDEFSARNLGDKEMTKGDVFLTKEEKERTITNCFIRYKHTKYLKLIVFYGQNTHMLMKNELSH